MATPRAKDRSNYSIEQNHHHARQMCLSVLNTMMVHLQNETDSDKTKEDVARLTMLGLTLDDCATWLDRNRKDSHDEPSTPVGD